MDSVSPKKAVQRRQERAKSYSEVLKQKKRPKSNLKALKLTQKAMEKRGLSETKQVPPSQYAEVLIQFLLKKRVPLSNKKNQRRSRKS